jgi:hypothetical protein
MPFHIKQISSEWILQSVFLLALAAGALPVYSEESHPAPRRFGLSPVYDDTIIGVAEREDENRKNRDIGYNVRFAGADIRYALTEKTSTGLLLTARQRIERYDDTKAGSIYESYVNFGPTYLYYNSPSVGLRGGRMQFNLMEGFIFFGEANGYHLLFRPKWLNRGVELGVFDFIADREEHLRGVRSGTERVTSAYARYDGERLSLELLGLYYRDPGWVAGFMEPDPTSGRVDSHRSVSSPDTGLHYYALRVGYLTPRFRMSAIAIGAEGFRVHRDLLSRPLPAKIGGGMAFASMGYAFGYDMNDAGCAEVQSGLCPFDSVRDGPLIEMAGLVLSRDRSDEDGSLSGYDAIRPGIRVMGGLFSQLLTSDMGFPAPFRNIGPDRLYQAPSETGTIPSNSDPAIPSYRTGMEAASLRFVFTVYSVRFDLFANHGNFQGGTGYEGIIRTHYRIDLYDTTLSLFAGLSNMRIHYEDTCENNCIGSEQKGALLKRVIFGASFRI